MCAGIPHGFGALPYSSLVNGRITVVGGEDDFRKPMDDVEVRVLH